MTTDFWPLTGGQLVESQLDVLAHDARLQVDVLSDGVATTHELLLQGVHVFRFFSEIEAPWAFADCTVWELIRTPSGRLQLELVLWDEEGGGLLVEFESGTLDGVALEP